MALAQDVFDRLPHVFEKVLKHLNWKEDRAALCYTFGKNEYLDDGEWYICRYFDFIEPWKEEIAARKEEYKNNGPRSRYHEEDLHPEEIHWELNKRADSGSEFYKILFYEVHNGCYGNQCWSCVRMDS
jgi:hypothetical protein